MARTLLAAIACLATMILLLQMLCWTWRENYVSWRMGKRKLTKFIYGVFPVLQRRMYIQCQQCGHCMVHATTWRWRQKGVNERYWCRHCQMEALIQFNPPAGFAQLHGVALDVPCTFDPERDLIVNPPDEVADGA